MRSTLQNFSPGLCFSLFLVHIFARKSSSFTCYASMPPQGAWSLYSLRSSLLLCVLRLLAVHGLHNSLLFLCFSWCIMYLSPALLVWIEIFVFLLKKTPLKGGFSFLCPLVGRSSTLAVVMLRPRYRFAVWLASDIFPVLTLARYAFFGYLCQFLAICVNF